MGTEDSVVRCPFCKEPMQKVFITMIGAAALHSSEKEQITKKGI
jgi:hypothetical protein